MFVLVYFVFCGVFGGLVVIVYGYLFEWLMVIGIIGMFGKIIIIYLVEVGLWVVGCVVGLIGIIGICVGGVDFFSVLIILEVFML